MYTTMGVYKKMKSMGRKAARMVKKRYMAKPGGRKSTGGVRVAKMAKDILYLKSVLNPEKKRDTQIGASSVAQVNANTDGRYFAEMTPIISQGVTTFTRNGASIKLHSSIYHFQFVQQLNTINPIKLVLELFHITEEPYAPASFNFFTERFNPNPFIGSGTEVRDYNSQINPDNYMKGRCIARRYLTLKSDQVSNNRNTLDLKLPIKYNNGQGIHIRYDKNTNTVEHGQLYLMIRADRGNFAGTPSTLDGAPDTAVFTGVDFRFNRTDYFYDN